MIDNRGHPFKKNVLDEQVAATTPSARGVVEDFRKQPVIPTPLEIEEDLARATRWLKIGDIFKEEQNDDNALENYANALKYTRKSEDYARIPPQMKKKPRNFCTNLLLWDDQKWSSGRL